MPKGKKQTGKKFTKVSTKFKLGNRKSTTSALAMTTEALLKYFQNPQMNKDRTKIQTVLRNRGIVDVSFESLTRMSVALESNA